MFLHLDRQIPTGGAQLHSFSLSAPVDSTWRLEGRKEAQSKHESGGCKAGEQNRGLVLER